MKTLKILNGGLLVIAVMCAVITEDEDGIWEITAGERNTPSCSAENNDNIEFAHNAEGGEE